jgi:hypothetical protein
MQWPVIDLEPFKRWGERVFAEVSFVLEPLVARLRRPVSEDWDEFLQKLALRNRAPHRTFPSTDRALYQAHTTEQRAPRNTLSGLRSRCARPRSRERRPMRSRPGTKRRSA